MNLSRIRRGVLGSLFVLLVIVPVWARTPSTTNSVPELYPLTTAATVPGGGAYTLTVRGWGFVSGSAVNWNGAGLATTFVSSSLLTAIVPATSLVTPSTATITVVSPTPGGGTSNFEYFVVQDAVPQNYFSSQSITGNANLTSPIVGADFNNDGKLDIVVASGPRHSRSSGFSPSLMSGLLARSSLK
jgi:IPT/TIG domain